MNTMSMERRLMANVGLEKHRRAEPSIEYARAAASVEGRTCGSVLSPTTNDTMPTGTLMRKMPSHA